MNSFFCSGYIFLEPSGWNEKVRVTLRAIQDVSCYFFYNKSNLYIFVLYHIYRFLSDLFQCGQHLTVEIYLYFITLVWYCICKQGKSTWDQLSIHFILLFPSDRLVSQYGKRRPLMLGGTVLLWYDSYFAPSFGLKFLFSSAWLSLLVYKLAWKFFFLSFAVYHFLEWHLVLLILKGETKIFHALFMGNCSSLKWPFIWWVSLWG